MEPRLRASPEQFSALIDFMERNGDLSRPQSGPQGRIKGDRLWQELTLLLNSLGGGVNKSSDKWKKVWADWKTKSKKKYLNIRLQANRTGGGPSSRIKLTALEERVVAVIGVSAVVGQAGIQEQGFHAGSAANDFPMEHAQYAFDTVLEDSQLSTPPPPSPIPPRTPPAHNNQRQASVSPRSTSTTPRRALLRARRNKRLTPFERAAELFATVERRRLVHEEARDKCLHEREMERLRLEAQRIDVAREQNKLLHQLSLLGQQLIDVITQQRPHSLPSTDPI